jgi:hypothetical protein
MAVDKAPYDRGGNLQHFPHDQSDWDDTCGRQPDGSWKVPPQIPPDWRPNTPFLATLTLRGMIRGRSAAYLQWADSGGRVYPMFLVDLVDLLKSRAVECGTVTAWWVVAKRGQNYGIQLATLRRPVAAVSAAPHV